MRFQRNRIHTKYYIVDTSGLRADTLTKLPRYAVWLRSTLAELPAYLGVYSCGAGVHSRDAVDTEYNSPATRP
jgi:hypothetical protein